MTTTTPPPIADDDAPRSLTADSGRPVFELPAPADHATRDEGGWVERHGRPFLVAVTALSFVLNAWGVEANGLGNTYYAAAARSMASNWHNWFFNAFDPGGYISVDKPPVALWIQALSVRVFGFSSTSLMLPSAIAGAAAVASALVHHPTALRRDRGHCLGGDPRVEPHQRRGQPAQPARPVHGPVPDRRRVGSHEVARLAEGTGVGAARWPVRRPRVQHQDARRVHPGSCNRYWRSHRDGGVVVEADRPGSRVRPIRGRVLVAVDGGRRSVGQERAPVHRRQHRQHRLGPRVRIQRLRARRRQRPGRWRSRWRRSRWSRWRVRRIARDVPVVERAQSAARSRGSYPWASRRPWRACGSTAGTAPGSRVS